MEINRKKAKKIAQSVDGLDELMKEKGDKRAGILKIAQGTALVWMKENLIQKL